MNFKAFDKFCGSTFWNTTLTWDTENPDLTICFEKTILVIVPAIFLWALLPLEIYYLKTSLCRDVPWNWKNVFKLFIAAALSVICTCDFLSNLSMEEPLYKVNVYMPVVKIFTFVLSGVLIYYNKKYGMQASGHQFIFWLVCTIGGLPQFVTEIRNIQSGCQIEKYFLYVSYLVYYPMVLVMFLLNCFADDPPRFHDYGKVEHKSTFHNCSFLGRILFTFVDGLLFTGYRKPLERKDMWRLDYENETKNLVQKFEELLQKKIMKNKKSFIEQKYGAADKPKVVSVLPIILQCFHGPFIMAVCLKLIINGITFINPQLLSLIIYHVSSDEAPWKGVLYASGMFIVGITSTLLHNSQFNRLWFFGLHTRICLVACIYRKALRISNSARKDRTVGEIVNLIAVDAQKFQELANHIPTLWSGPIEMSLALYFLWREVGPAILAGLGVLLLLIPLNTFIVRIAKRLQVKQMKQKDERVKVMNEILNGIKVLKLYAWEPSFQKCVEAIRLAEIAILLKAAYLRATTQFLFNSAPFVVSFVTFGTYVLIDENNVLTASKVFVSLSLLNILRNPLNLLPDTINMLVQTTVALGRINRFLNSEELESYVEHNADEADPLVIENGSFSWGDDNILSNINLRVPKNSLVAVVGPVGSGKSSIINALLGEMIKTEGRVNTYGKVAFVSQQAWIQNATVKENIIFGKPFDEIRYNQILDACALRPDLEMLADGDITEIGEKGINLSGGQKQRVNLARAVYDDADVYLIDDPLSAVDSHVGKHIFSHVIGPDGLLNGKVRVLVTHAVTYLSKTQKIFVMKDGEISESGCFTDLLSENGDFAEFFMQYMGGHTTDEDVLKEVEEQIGEIPLTPEMKRKISQQRSRLTSVSSDGSENRLGSKTFSIENISSPTKKRSLASSKLSLQDKKSKQMKGKLIQIEKSEKGNVKLVVFKYYLTAIGAVTIAFTILLYSGFHGFGIAANLWLGIWTEDPNTITADGAVDTRLRNMYLIVYLVLGLSQGFCMFAASSLFARGSITAAEKLHNILMGAVMRLPMIFFDVTPVGRILARFSSDIVGVDSSLPNSFNAFFNNSLKIFGSIAVICYTTPFFTFVIIPIAAFYIFIQRYFVSSSRQLKRLESVSRSPIFTHFSETLTGAPVIRAYRCSDRFINEFEKRVDSNQMYLIPSSLANRWLSVRLEIMGNSIVLASALFAVLNRDLNAALVGLSVSYALQITSTLTHLVRMVSDVETSIVCVERIKEYSEIKQEKPWIIAGKRPNRAWPNEGCISFENYSVNYRPGLDLVLKGISFQVNGGEKIGIVGRTGAGKSSLTLSLFRIIEAIEGGIFIDGVQISEIGLHDLRSRLTIIPQDAVIFSGTLRTNLDPFYKYSDEAVWRAIDLAHLKSFVSSLSAGLQHKLSEGGDNLSVGQRQLICLARALLRKTKILILDEATAAVDLETDDLIQKTIRTAFGDCTVLTIAHRLNTILDSNRVLVLDKGEIAEFDTPDTLIGNHESIFFGMCKDAGLVN